MTIYCSMLSWFNPKSNFALPSPHQAYERLSDNISFLVGQDGDMTGRKDLESRLSALHSILEDLQKRYVMVKK